VAYTLCKINLVAKENVSGIGSFSYPKGMAVEQLIGGDGVLVYTRLADNNESPGFSEYSVFPDENRVVYNSFPTLLIFKLALLISNKPSNNVYDINLDSPTGFSATYLPLLASAPVVTEDAKNAFEGLITLQTISIKILGDNQAAKKVFASRFSATDQNFEIWRELNDGTIRKIYKGLGFGLVSADSQSVTYKAKPILADFSKKADFGLNFNWPGPEETLGEVPIIHCAVIPYTEKIAQNQDYENESSGLRYLGESISWPTMEKSTLPKISYFRSGLTVNANIGIVFFDLSLSKFADCARPIRQGGVYDIVNTCNVFIRIFSFDIFLSYYSFTPFNIMNSDFHRNS